jgi:adenosylhomocysteine nucleosidase
MATDSPAEPMHEEARADIGIVCALPMELAEFLGRCERVRSYTGEDFTFRGGIYDGIRVVIAETGTGMARARRGTAALIDAHQPRWVLSCGYAGGLQRGPKRGDIVVPPRILAPDQPEIHLEFKMPADPAKGLYVGGLLTVDQIIRKAADKQSLGEAHQAVAVDMETYAVAAECRARHQKFFAVRVLTDDAETDLPEEVLSLMGSTGAMRIGAIVGALWKRPSSAQDMLQLRDDAQVAAKRLADFLDGVLHQLHAAM